MCNSYLQLLSDHLVSLPPLLASPSICLSLPVLVLLSQSSSPLVSLPLSVPALVLFNQSSLSLVPVSGLHGSHLLNLSCPDLDLSYSHPCLLCRPSLHLNWRISWWDADQLPWSNQVLLSWEEVGCTTLHNLNVPTLRFHKIKEGGGLGNSLWDAKGCSCVCRRRHQIICSLKFPHGLLLPLSYDPQVSTVLLSQSQNLTHPGDEAVLPRRHLARVWGKVLVVAMVLHVRLARMESKMLSWMMVVPMTPAHDNLEVEYQYKDTKSPTTNESHTKGLKQEALTSSM